MVDQNYPHVRVVVLQYFKIIVCLCKETIISLTLACVVFVDSNFESRYLQGPLMLILATMMRHLISDIISVLSQFNTQKNNYLSITSLFRSMMLFFKYYSFVMRKTFHKGCLCTYLIFINDVLFLR